MNAPSLRWILWDHSIVKRSIVLLAFMFVGLTARDAFADITAFIGVTPTPQNHVVRGFALGFGLLVVGFEFEYANAIEDSAELLPSLQTGSGNIYVQTPVEISGIRIYGTTGGGYYRERLSTTQETNFCSNIGGGAKIRLAGPLKVRLDYRIFRLNGEPIHQTYHRFYAGANFAF
jgi:hypothetical protein